jgi:hypothetical protein
VSETAQGLLIGHEKSRQWHRIVSGEIPEELDVFLILWVDRDSKKFVSHGFYFSTSEGAPPNTDPFIACEMTVPIVASDGKSRAQPDLQASAMIAAQVLAKQLVHDPDKARIWQQYVENRREQKRGPRLPMDVIDTRDFEHYFGKAIETARSRHIAR